MRVHAPVAPSVGLGSAKTRRAGSGSFQVGDGETAGRAKGAAALRTVGGIDALVALQGVDDPAERRRRAVRRGRIALDALEEIKVGLLGGNLSATVTSRLRALTAELREPVADPGLETVLGEIRLRVEVELAKLNPDRSENRDRL